MSWSHSVIDDADGTCRVEVVGEDGEPWPIARQLTPRQAETLIQRVASEAQRSGRPIKTVIRDPYFMAATVITVKRLPS